MVIKNEFFVFQLNAHVVFAGSNVFELQLNLHGVSFPKYFMQINQFTIVLLAAFLVELNLSILPDMVLRSPLSTHSCFHAKATKNSQCSRLLGGG